ncbi:hypothetical protein KH5H1_17920 [Corallococcus caeni]|nr:hypothetical protein KH5H1_17920 [Corallococcus sp. KH5-1]
MPISDLQDVARTDAEARFLEALLHLQPELDVWRHETAEGHPWLIVSMDFVEGGSVRDTLRLDFDGRAIRGGWSPGLLNWDDGVPAQEAGVDVGPPDGIEIEQGAPAELAAVAASWFARHVRQWKSSPR